MPRYENQRRINRSAGKGCFVIFLFYVILCLSLSGCTSLPEPPGKDKYFSLLTMLPEGRPVYFSLRPSDNSQLLVEVFNKSGPMESSTVMELLERTTFAIGSLKELPEQDTGAVPAIDAVFLGAYPSTILQLGLSLDMGWLRRQISAENGIREVWVNTKSSMFLILLNRRTIYAGTGDPAEAVSRIASIKRERSFPEFVMTAFYNSSAAVYLDMSILRPEEPMADSIPLGAGLFEGVDSLKLPIQNTGLRLKENPEITDGDKAYELSGYFRLSSERQAKAFQGTFRFIILSWAIRNGYDTREITKNVSITRTGDKVNFEGISITPDEIMGFFPKEETVEE